MPYDPKTLMRDAARDAVKKSCALLGLADCESEVLDILQTMTASWGERRLEDPPLLSLLEADATPLELSLVLGGAQSDLRFALEPQPGWDAQVSLAESLAEKYGAHLGRYREVLALLPRQEKAFVNPHWFALVYRRGRAPMFKTYVSLQDVEGGWRSVLDRLGMSRAADRIAERMSPLETAMMLSLDLVDSRAARVKMYVQHHGDAAQRPAGEEFLDRAEAFASLSPDFDAGETRTFLETMLRESPTAPLIVESPPLTTLYLTEASERIHTTSCVLRSSMWARMLGQPFVDDGVFRERVLRALEALRIDPGPYPELLASFADGDLANERWLHTSVALHREDGKARVTVYCNPKFYGDRIGPPPDIEIARKNLVEPLRAGDSDA